MCYYITATLPNEVNLEELNSYFDKFNMDFSPINNDNVKSQLRPNELYLRATKSYCDCDTVLGYQNPSQEYDKLLKSKKVRALKKKKWSEEKIDIWIKNKISSKQHKTVPRKTPMEIHQEIDNWMIFLHTLLNMAKIERIGLLKHWYITGLVSEEIRIKKTETIRSIEINPDLLLNLEEDVLYEFFATHSS